MATDYDAPRRDPEEVTDVATLEEVRARRADPGRALGIELDEPDDEESIEPPGADLSGEQLFIKALPPQPDEFTCTSCFLLVHRSRQATTRDGKPICQDCVN